MRNAGQLQGNQADGKIGRRTLNSIKEAAAANELGPWTAAFLANVRFNEISRPEDVDGQPCGAAAPGPPAIPEPQPAKKDDGMMGILVIAAGLYFMWWYAKRKGK